jgi:23S rRNA (cytidine1920-2'-O)/16S rRNA (cytidine1409-2'-O)-methyltransferase
LKQRIDRLLVERGMVPTREKAQALVMAGLVLVDGRPATKAGMLVADSEPLQLKDGGSPYVGRGGLKIEGVAARFGLNPAGLVCADIGASTGGFTQFLLRGGARRVYAIDVDVKQLAWTLRQDSRVVPIERNARFLDPADPGEPVSVVTVDVSFISLTLVLPRVPALLASGGTCTALVKPQFEVGRDRVGRGGIVRDPADWRAAIEKCTRSGRDAGLELRDQAESPVPGREGNREFFLHFQKS